MRNLKTRKCPYIAHFGLKWKNKTTLFCQTFKVEEKKVVSFFNFELNQARYGHFLVFNIFALISPFVKFEPPCGTPKSASIWLKFFLVYILMYWNGINNLLSTFEKLFEIWSTLMWVIPVGRSVFESLFQIILIGVLSLSLGSIEMMGILFIWIQWGFGSPASQSLFTIWNSFQVKEKNQNGYISLTLARNEKIRPLYFIQLLKLNKTKWSYFFNLS